MGRPGSTHRKTRETEISVHLELDGQGRGQVQTGIPFFDHMLTAFAAHGFIDLDLTAQGDTEVDFHHTVEDVGICLGDALKEALDRQRSLRRYGWAFVPMDDALARVVLDLSNRPHLAYRVPWRQTHAGGFDCGLLQEFFRAVVVHAGLTLHIDLLAGDEPHHIAEAIFKAFGRALDLAAGLEPRLGTTMPSTKGVL